MSTLRLANNTFTSTSAVASTLAQKIQAHKERRDQIEPNLRQAQLDFVVKATSSSDNELNLIASLVETPITGKHVLKTILFSPPIASGENFDIKEQFLANQTDVRDTILDYYKEKLAGFFISYNVTKKALVVKAEVFKPRQPKIELDSFVTAEVFKPDSSVVTNNESVTLVSDVKVPKASEAKVPKTKAPKASVPKKPSLTPEQLKAKEDEKKQREEHKKLLVDRQANYTEYLQSCEDKFVEQACCPLKRISGNMVSKLYLCQPNSSESKEFPAKDNLGIEMGPFTYVHFSKNHSIKKRIVDNLRFRFPDCFIKVVVSDSAIITYANQRDALKPSTLTLGGLVSNN
jgi:hypothetical protein